MNLEMCICVCECYVSNFRNVFYDKNKCTVLQTVLKRRRRKKTRVKLKCNCNTEYFFKTCNQQKIFSFFIYEFTGQQTVALCSHIYFYIIAFAFFFLLILHFSNINFITLVYQSPYSINVTFIFNEGILFLINNGIKLDVHFIHLFYISVFSIRIQIFCFLYGNMSKYLNEFVYVSYLDYLIRGSTRFCSKFCT